MLLRFLYPFRRLSRQTQLVAPLLRGGGLAATSSLFQSGLLQDLAHQSDAKILFRVWDRQVPGLRWVNQNVVAPVDSPDGPPVVPKSLKQLPTVHGVYYTHYL